MRGCATLTIVRDTARKFERTSYFLQSPPCWPDGLSGLLG